LRRSLPWARIGPPALVNPGELLIKKFVVALLLLPLTQSVATAQNAPAGNAAQGKTYWESPLTACKNCHGANAEGAFGPDLAGRGLNTGQVARAVRQPWGIMPAFVESQLNDQQAADLAAYFAGMPKPAQPGKWRFEAAAGTPPGQATMINVGCGQCHTPLFQGPRGNMGAVNMDFDYFATSSTTTQRPFISIGCRSAAMPTAMSIWAITCPRA